MEKVKMLEEIVGKLVNVWTINGSYKGTVENVECDWIKIVSGGKKKTEYILKIDMITSITVLY